MNPWKRNKEPPDLLSSVLDSLSASSSLDLSRSQIVVGSSAWLCRNYVFCHALDLRTPSDLVPLRDGIEFGPFAPIRSLARSPVAAQATIRPAAVVVFLMEVRPPTSSSFKRTQVNSLPPLSPGNLACYSLSCLDLVISFLEFRC